MAPNGGCPRSAYPRCRTPPPLDVVLPDDPRVRDLRVHPHRLADYDALLAPPPPAAPEGLDEPTA